MPGWRRSLWSPRRRGALPRSAGRGAVESLGPALFLQGNPCVHLHVPGRVEIQPGDSHDRERLIPISPVAPELSPRGKNRWPRLDKRVAHVDLLPRWARRGGGRRRGARTLRAAGTAPPARAPISLPLARGANAIRSGECRRGDSPSEEDHLAGPSSEARWAEPHWAEGRRGSQRQSLAQGASDVEVVSESRRTDRCQAPLRGSAVHHGPIDDELKRSWGQAGEGEERLRVHRGGKHSSERGAQELSRHDPEHGRRSHVGESREESGDALEDTVHPIEGERNPRREAARWPLRVGGREATGARRGA